MITLLGSLLGFISSAFPELLRLYREQKDRRHELELLDRQQTLTRQDHQQRLEAIHTSNEQMAHQALYQHAQPTGIIWVDALAGTVRPVITYAFFVLYAGVKVAQWVLVQSVIADHNWAEALVTIWHLEDQALFATVVSFWFGQRLLMKARLNWKQ